MPTQVVDISLAPKASTESIPVVLRSPTPPLPASEEVPAGGACEEEPPNGSPPVQVHSPVAESPPSQAAEIDLEEVQRQQEAAESAKALLEAKDRELQELRLKMQQQIRDTEFRTLVECGVTTAPSAFLASGPPASALLIYSSLAHWGCFEPGEDRSLLEDEFHRLSLSIAATVKKNGDDFGALCYWAHTTLFLFELAGEEASLPFPFDTQGPNPLRVAAVAAMGGGKLSKGEEGIPKLVIMHPSPHSRTTDFQKEMVGLTGKIFSQMAELAFSFLKPALAELLDLETPQGGESGGGNKRHSMLSTASLKEMGRNSLASLPPADRIKVTLMNSCEDMKASNLPAFFSAQFLGQVFVQVDHEIFTALLRHPHLCCAGRLMELKLQLSELEQWAEGEAREATKGIPRRVAKKSHQAINVLLMANKHQVLEEEMQSLVCPDLGPPALAKLLENYSVDEFDSEGFPYASVRSIKYGGQDGGGGSSLGYEAPPEYLPLLFTSIPQWATQPPGTCGQGQAEEGEGEPSTPEGQKGATEGANLWDSPEKRAGGQGGLNLLAQHRLEPNDIPLELREHTGFSFLLKSA